MTEKLGPRASKLPVSASYEVGYGKPPPAKRFQKGASGNPRGRPKGSKNKPDKKLLKLRDILLEEAGREVTIQDKSGPLSMPVAQAAVRSLALKAAQGTVGAQKLFLESIAHAESHAAQEKEDIVNAALHYKRNRQLQIKDHEQRGVPLEDEMYVPDPAHIDIDLWQQEVTFRGPVDDKSKKLWDELWQIRQGQLDEIAYLCEELEKGDKAIMSRSHNEYSLAAERYILTACEATIIVRFNCHLEDVVEGRLRHQEVEHFIAYRKERGTFPPRPRQEDYEDDKANVIEESKG